MAIETGGIAALVAKYWVAIKGLAFKSISLALGAGAATYIVMSMQRPQEDKEWKQALFATVMFSICGGAAVIQYFGLKAWFDDFVGLVAVIGLAFACGLPGWFLVRSVFIWQRQNEGKSITALLRELISLRGGGQS